MIPLTKFYLFQELINLVTYVRFVESYYVLLQLVPKLFLVEITLQTSFIYC